VLNLQKSLAFPLAGAALALILAGCADGNTPGADTQVILPIEADREQSHRDASVRERRVIGDQLLALGTAASTKSLLTSVHAVAVVEIVSAADVSVAPGYVSDENNSGEEATGYVSGLSAPTLTEYTARVESVAYDVTDLQEGTEIVILQSGGIAAGIAWEMEGDPLIEVGGRYFIFLGIGPTRGSYFSTPLGRFDIESGTLAPVEEWARLGVAQELTGKTVAEASALIELSSEGVVPSIEPTPALDRR